METKLCRNCGETKPLSEFTKAAGYKDGYKNWCKFCANARNQDWRHSNPDKARAINNRSAGTENAKVVRKAWRSSVAEETGQAYDHDYMVSWRAKNVAENPDFFWESGLRHNYQMSRERYDALLAEQNGGCAICGGVNDADTRLCVDHDHGCCPKQKKSCGK
ncbi:MAG: endonuclease domain-containing protein, partial [Candidatus Sulfotelmatobacter sp.]